MLKLNTAYAKKVPAETEYSSQSYHVCMEVELSDGLTPEQIEAKIHENFDLLRKSVEDELKTSSIRITGISKSTSDFTTFREVFSWR